MIVTTTRFQSRLYLDRFLTFSDAVSAWELAQPI